MLVKLCVESAGSMVYEIPTASLTSPHVSLQNWISHVSNNTAAETLFNSLSVSFVKIQFLSPITWMVPWQKGSIPRKLVFLIPIKSKYEVCENHLFLNSESGGAWSGGGGGTNCSGRRQLLPRNGRKKKKKSPVRLSVEVPKPWVGTSTDRWTDKWINIVDVCWSTYLDSFAILLNLVCHVHIKQSKLDFVGFIVSKLTWGAKLDWDKLDPLIVHFKRSRTFFLSCTLDSLF
jgi:hypothetical protein